MLPVRPRSRATAASSARTAGADPSYPTTRYRFPVAGMTVFIGVSRVTHHVHRGAEVAPAALLGATCAVGEPCRSAALRVADDLAGHVPVGGAHRTAGVVDDVVD